MAKIGDIVRFLNSVGGGKIVRIKDNIAYVEEDDGFETPVLLRECVVVTPAGSVATPSKPKGRSQEAAVAPPAPSKEAVAPKVFSAEDVEVEKIEETPGGNRLNVVLGFEPTDIKRLSDTDYDVYLVNDSNYYLYFTYLVRSDLAEGWTTKFAGVVEPNIQVLVDEMKHADISGLDKIAVQYVAFKRDREFDLKPPTSVEWRVDTTKFFKLHCFHSNPYFESDVIAFDIVTDDVPARQKFFDAGQLEKGIKEKTVSMRPIKKPVSRRASATDSLVVDLHASELIDTTRGMSNADILNMPVDKFREVMDANLSHKGKRIVFIHGKGEGVLRQALMKELNYRYKTCGVQDASFREYGYGATQVTIR